MKRTISRRDWFRLQVRRQNKMLDLTLTDQCTDATNGLRPIEHPPNHDGLDLSELPPMREATLLAEQVDSLFDDIEKLGSDILLMQRSVGAQRASASRVGSAEQLETAKAALLSGSIQRLQVRYCWQGQHWIDTLRREKNGFHLVRIAHQMNS